MSADFHKLAKDAGNKLRAYVLTYCSAATGLFFLALSGKDAETFTYLQKSLLVFALVLFVLTVVMCLYELHIDARRFFYVAKQLELPENQQVWPKNDSYKKLRLRLIYGSYITSGFATLAVVIFLITKIT
jgi:ABC-type phosphate transport system permease subunit